MNSTIDSAVGPVVGVVMGSDSDWPVMQLATKVLDDFDIAYEVDVVSAHRMPDEMITYGLDAEERGQSEAIGKNLYAMAGLRVPIVVSVIGEGGSGGGSHDARFPGARAFVKHLAAGPAIE